MSKRLSPLLSLAFLGQAVCSCSSGKASEPGSSDEVEFKTAAVDNAVVKAGVTNVLALPFTAPSNGFTWTSATGTCGVVEPLPVTSVLAAQVETSPTANDPNPGDGALELGGGSAGPTTGSFSAARALPVNAGENILYLNIDNPSSGGTMYCSAAMAVVFSSQQLP